MSRQIEPWVGEHTVTFYEVGEPVTGLMAGDVILVDHGTDVSWAIRTGEHALAFLSEHELYGYTWLDHCAIIREDTKGFFEVSEMGPRGHELRPIKHYQDKLVAVLHFNVSDETRQRVLDSDARLHDIRYGWFQYPFLVLNGLSGAKITASWGSSMICSTAVTWCVKNLYWTPDRQDTAVIPSHIAYWTGALHD